ncbi:MAG: uracil-xanthine permease family protein [Sciscionella sp.]
MSAISIGFQNILGLAGLLLFPGLIGHAYSLSPSNTAYLYGITFMTSGLVVIFQSVWLLRLPIVQGPFAGVFAAILVIGHERGGLGVTFGSLLVAALIWSVLAIPLRRYNVVTALSRYLQHSIVAGVVLIIIAVQLGTIALPGWIGKPGEPGFPGVNALSAVIGAFVVLVCMGTAKKFLRRGAVLWAVIIGAVVFSLLAPTTWGNVLKADVFNAPRLFPFGFGVDPVATVTFFILLFPAISETVATYEIVARWAEEPLPAQRSAQGVFAEMLGSAIGAFFGGMTTLAYPDNVGFLRVHRVASRWVTLTTGIILLVLGGFGYFDATLVAIPSPVLSGVTAILFGILFAGGLQMLSRVEWNQGSLVVAGVPTIIAIGLLFTPKAVEAKLPPSVALLFGQPLVVGTVLALVGVAILAWLRRGVPGKHEERSGA